ncbi:MAG TPA: copper amine oxidase N-terminal domain-containing protein [Candidatus Baltobacteraceae bacterium]|jgi:hypothetical protein
MTYRKPAWQTIVLTAAAATMASALLALSRPVEMRVDGQTLQSDVSPVTTSDKVYVPLRPLAEALGATTSENKATGEVIVSRGDKSLRVKVGDMHATFNGMPMTLKHAPFRVQGRVMIGMKAFGRAFGVRVSYDKRTSRVDVRTGVLTSAETVDNSTE